MTGNIIPSPVNGSPKPARPVGQAGEGIDSGKTTRNFSALLDQFRNPPLLGTELLSPGRNVDSDAAAKPFDAEGFFAKLVVAIDERHAECRAAPAQVQVDRQTSVDVPPLVDNDQPVSGDSSVQTESQPPDGLQANGPLRRSERRPTSARPFPWRVPPQQNPFERPVLAPIGQASDDLAHARPIEPGSGASPETSFRLWLDGTSVCIAGPIELLTPDEESQLVEALTNMLLEHGLEPGDLLLNGRSFEARTRKARDL